MRTKSEKQKKRERAEKTLEKMKMLKAYSDSRGAKTSQKMKALATLKR